MSRRSASQKGGLPRADQRGRLGRTFLTVWLGQLVSQFGSSMTGFAMSIVVFEVNQSVTELAMVLLAANLPGILLAPIAGVYVDRWNRRSVMLVADSVAAASTLGLAAMLASGEIVLWAVLVAVAIASVAGTFQEPAYSAAVPTLVDSSELGRANGLVQMGPAVAILASPIAAAAILATAGITAVLLVDVATFLVAVATLAVVRFPDVARRQEREPAVWSEAREGFTFISARRGLLVFLFMAAGLNFFLSISNVLWTPLILAYGDEIAVGTALSSAGGAMVVGAVIMSAWGGPRRRIRGMVLMMLCGGAAVAVAGLRPSLIFAIAGGVVLMLLIPIVNGTSQTLWQLKVPFDLQGRVFALRRMVATIATPVSFILAGPLADRVFEPLLASGGHLEDTFIAAIWGVGPGRGIGLLFGVVGLGIVVMAVAGWAHPRMRHVESEVPDAPQPETDTVLQS